jgi:myosin heavy subunit
MKTTFEPIKINRISKSESRQSVMNLKKSFSKAKFRSVFKIDIVEANLEKVWVAANGKGTWKLCNIVSRNDTMLTLLDASGDRLSVDTRHIQTHPYNNNFVSDMSSLRHLNEPSIYHNISMRYKEHMPYSYMGTVLIAMNPFQYTAEPEITQYAGLRLNPELPHPFALSGMYQS